jgi:hypothetical protein
MMSDDHREAPDWRGEPLIPMKWGLRGMGALIGLSVGGPIGASVGGMAGAALGKILDDDRDQQWIDYAKSK